MPLPFSRAARGHEQQRHREIRRRLGEHLGGIGDRHPRRLRRGNVDVVEAHAVIGEQSGPAAGRIDDVGRHLVGHAAQHDVGRSHGLLERVRAHRLVVRVEARVELRGNLLLDGGWNLPGDDNDRSVGAHARIIFTVRLKPDTTDWLRAGHYVLSRHGLRPALLGRTNAAARDDAASRVAKRHLNAGQRAEQHQLVEIAHVADAEQLPRHLGEARAERQVVPLVGDVDDVLALDVRRHHDRADRVGVPLRRLRAQVQAPGFDRRPDALGETMMTGEHVLEAFLEQHRDRLAQAVQHRHRRRVRESSRSRSG